MFILNEKTNGYKKKEITEDEIFHLISTRDYWMEKYRKRQDFVLQSKRKLALYEKWIGRLLAIITVLVVSNILFFFK